MRELSWPLSGPLPPGDALKAGRADTRCRLRLPVLAASHHCGLLIPPLTGATAARGTGAPPGGSIGDQSTPPPSLAYRAATSWPSRCPRWVQAARDPNQVTTPIGT